MIHTENCKCVSCIFQPHPLDIKDSIEQSNARAVPPEDLTCSEYCFRVSMNPFQHPCLDPNIHHLTAVLTALSNTCGGVVYLSYPESTLVADELFCLFKSRLISLLDIHENLVEISQGGENTFWAITVAKTSRDPLPCKFHKKCVHLWVDIRGQLQQKKPNKEDGQKTLEDTGGDTSGPVPKETGDVGDNLPSKISKSNTEATNDEIETLEQSPADYSTVRELNWDENKKNWHGILEIETPSLEGHIDSCDMWNPCLPMRITPNRESLRHLFPSEAVCYDTIQKLETKTAGFAIASKSWTCLLPGLDRQRPANHLCDILTIAKGQGHEPTQLNICLWVIVSSSTEQVIQKQFQYMFIVGRAIKHQLANQDREFPDVVIRCTLHSTHPGDNATIENSLLESGMRHMQEFLCSSFKGTATFDSVQRCLALLLLTQESPIKTCAGDQLSVKLSANQAKELLKIKSKKVAYVSSPPGTGKTLCGLALYIYYGKSHSVYISPTEPLLQYLRYNGCEATLVRNDEDLYQHMKSGIFENKVCVIIDESHRLRCSKASLGELFMLMKKHGMRLFVFADNAYQSFDRENQQQIQSYIYELSTEVWGVKPYEPILTEIFRNTRKVVSFLQHAMGDPDSDSSDILDITCANAHNGDGIHCIAMENLLDNRSDNGLVQYLHPLLDNRYHVTDVAVLLDNGYTDDDISAVRAVLQNHLPGVTTQSSETFPREGIIVDRVERFAGLDAALCIFLLRIGASTKQDATIENPRYRVYLASRATHKAVFVVPRIDADVVCHMKFDHFLVSFIRCH